MQNFTYIGSGDYCYSNSAAMLLALVGEQILPSLIEVVGGVGTGAFVLPNSNIAFLSGFSALPDQCLTKALQILGFAFAEKFSESAKADPLDELKKLLCHSPVLLGPLDMGYLSYMPRHKSNHGVDHFVLAVEIRDGIIVLHDPKGYPNVVLSLPEMVEAWKVESISYKRGHYRYWALPKRIARPSNRELYLATLEHYRNLYRDGDKDSAAQKRLNDIAAILFMSENIRTDLVSEQEKNMLMSFIFPITARRAGDIYDFFKTTNETLANIKLEQSRVMGECQYCASNNNWVKVSELLVKFASLEESFKESVQLTSKA